MGLRHKRRLHTGRWRAHSRPARLSVPVAVALVLLRTFLCAGACQASPESGEPASLTQGAGAQAIASLNKLLNEPHPDSGALLRMGIGLAQQGLFPEAARAFARCVRDYPDLFEGHYNLALAELAEEHYPQAYVAIDRAPHRTAAESTARVYLRGKIEASWGRIPAAEQDLSAAFSHDPGSENYALDLGLLYLRTHAYLDAEHVFAKSSAVNPHSTYLLLGLALAQFLGGHTAQSLEASRGILARDPAFSPARLLLGFALYIDGNIREAREVAHQGLQFPGPDPYLYYLEAAALLKLHGKEYGQILSDLAAAKKGIPDCALCYVASGKVHAQQNDLRGALSDLQQAVGLDPDLSEGWYHLASTYDRLGYTAEAAKARERFQALKANADEREKQMLRTAVLESLGGQGSGGP